jgi:8-oxo-dGTP pyrophosphatase MutT (NUDIX family)
MFTPPGTPMRSREMFTSPGTPMRPRGGALTPRTPCTPRTSHSAPSTPRLFTPGTCRTPASASRPLTPKGAEATQADTQADTATTTEAAPVVQAPPAPDGAGLVVFQSRHSGLHFLVLRSRHGTRQWSFPKGHLNAREAALACALRETQEETGLGQDQLQLVSDFRRRIEIVLPRPTKTVPSGRKHVIFFLARARRGAVTKLSSEHSEMQWVCASQAARLLPSEQRELLEHAVRAARESS